MGMVRMLMPRSSWTKPEGNTRQSWRVVWARGEAQKRVVKRALSCHEAPPIPLVVTLVRVSAGTLDTDNLCGSLKRVRDAVATWIGCGDSPDDPIEWRYDQRRGPRGQQSVEIHWEAGE